MSTIYLRKPNISDLEEIEKAYKKAKYFIILGHILQLIFNITYNKKADISFV